MEMETDTKNNTRAGVEESVHHILAHSYSFYFLLFLVSFFLDLAFPIKIFSSDVFNTLGFIFLIFATLIIIWAQKTSRKLSILEEVKTEHFCRGPYCYTRSPTHWGLFFLMLGFGIIINALFVVLATLISMVVAKLVFLRKEEKLLTQKYGDSYTAYKKMVKF